MAKVFISHASADEDVVSLFVDNILCSGSGLPREDIFFSSREDTGVLNGDDIPSAIKDGIRCCEMFFMMVSEAYRKREVCLNEMGAAWMMDDLPKKIILLPGVGFNSIGWLMSLRKGTQMTDEEGLDAIHDQVLDCFSLHVQTSTWNRNKRKFLQEIKHAALPSVPSVAENEVTSESDEDSDILDYQERFILHMRECTRMLKEITSAQILCNTRLNNSAARLRVLQQNKEGVTTAQIRNVMTAIAKDMDDLSDTLESNSMALKDHFTQAIDNAIAMQKSSIRDESVKKTNRRSCYELIEEINGVKTSIIKVRDIINSVPDLDKTYRKSKNRLLRAYDGLQDVMVSCIRKANEIQVI